MWEQPWGDGMGCPPASLAFWGGSEVKQGTAPIPALRLSWSFSLLRSAEFLPWPVVLLLRVALGVEAKGWKALQPVAAVVLQWGLPESSPHPVQGRTLSCPIRRARGRLGAAGSARGSCTSSRLALQQL